MSTNVLFLLIVIFSSIDADHLSQIEHDTLEYRVKQAETIVFGRFHWLLPISPTDDISQVYSFKQKTFEFLVYCTIKKKTMPNNVPHVIRITIEDDGTKMKKKKKKTFDSNWFFRNGNRHEKESLVRFVSKIDERKKYLVDRQSN